MDSERYIFEAEWFDKVACVVKKFLLYYYVSDNSVELYDLKTKKTFLRRTKCEGVEEKDFYVGALITIFSRSMRLINFADCNTKTKLSSKAQKTLAIIMPDIIDKMGEILKKIAAQDLHIGNIKMVNFTKDSAIEFYKGKSGSDLSRTINYVISGPIVAIELLGEDCVARWQELTGPNDSSEAREKAPSSIRACYGKDFVQNAVYGSADVKSADKELKFFFPDPKCERKGFKNTATFEDCTCCIIKPHALQSRLTGHIVDDIQKAGYLITAIQLFHVDPINVEEFLEVYKGVLPDYGAIVAELQSGPCITMEIKHKDKTVNVPVEFRKLCGPMDPEIAKHVRPDTLRAKYGKTRVQNAVHCSDLPEDGLLEVEYFFKILDES
ncbi:nucleoside diphosphate kinase 7 [Belonocnema kinseyi]|uniref:nucleoside diphosphate kinase 7 n=1 Tax=Belonocnema kinseyi TaxID=2817044 RepID=UPI00143D4F71|nr:nucleoside diphosphate kinase 7 [Belonocnema kinseyi]